MTAQPQDHKSPVEPFVWTAPDGRTVTLKPMGKIKAGVFRKVRHLNEMDATFTLLEEATDAAGLSVIDDLDSDQLDKVFEAWAAGADVKPGESSGSSS